MSYEIIKNITVKGDSVFITSAPSNVSPRVFQKWSADSYNEIYRQSGLKALLQEISKDLWHGNYQLCSGGSKYVKALQASFDALNKYSHPLRYFLDQDRGSELIANITVKYLDSHTFSSQDFAPYEALRSDREAVLDICSKNPMAFSHADLSIQKDRAAAKAYVERCSDKLLFQFPYFFRNDKEIAEIGLENNGCIYRQLDLDLRCDRNITRLAFDGNKEGRAFHEHLPDMIPVNLRADPLFMGEILTLCPQLHIHRTPEILSNRETALLATQVCTHISTFYNLFSNDYLKDPAFQKAFLSRCNTPYDHKLLKNLYASRNLPFPGGLDAIIADASSRQQVSQEGRENQQKLLSQNNLPSK